MWTKVAHADGTVGQPVDFGPDVLLLHVVTSFDLVALADTE